MCLVTVGQPYHCQPFQQDGMVAEFFGSDFNQLIVSFAGIRPEEVASFDGKLTAGIYSENGTLVVFFEWAGGYRNVSACPVNTRLYDADAVAQSINIAEGHRFTVSQIVLERVTNVVQSFRFFTLPPELTEKIVEAVQAQQSGQFTKEKIQDNNTKAIFSHPTDIAALDALKIEMFECGR